MLCQLRLRSLADGRARGQRFNTASLPTSAERPAVVDAHVTAFTGCPCSAVIKLSIENHPRADPGANRRVENVTVPRACSPERFCESGRVRVIVDLDR